MFFVTQRKSQSTNREVKMGGTMAMFVHALLATGLSFNSNRIKQRKG
jgi:hypothetical protein